MVSTNPTIKVGAFVLYPPDTAPGQRFRIEQWMPHLQQQGIQVELIPFADASLAGLVSQPGQMLTKLSRGAAAFFRRLSHCVFASRYDVVLITRALCIAGPAILERLMPLFRRPVLYDFDDAIWLLHTSAVNRRFGWLKFPGKTATICRLSDHIVVGNTFLADYARRFNPKVTVVPTSVDTDRYRPQRKPTGGTRVVLGWPGSSTSQTHLEMFAPVLRELRGHRDFDLRVVSNREPDLPGIPYTWRPWSAETEVAEIGAFDLGIMPMPDDPWAHGKCALKALQYMAMGIPAVGSAVGANREVIQHRQNGLLASTPEEWLDHLTALIDDPLLRSQVGAAGRHTVEESYSAIRSAARFAAVVRETLNRDR